MNYRKDADLSVAELHDLKVVLRFIQIYCQKKHAARNRTEVGLPSELANKLTKKAFLCHECAELFSYGVQKRKRCPLDPKPICKKCHVHCYSTENRAKIREIMAFSGRRMVLSGRLDYLWHYFS